MYDPAGRTHRKMDFEEYDNNYGSNDLADAGMTAAEFASRAEVEEMNALKAKFENQMKLVHKYLGKAPKRNKNLYNPVRRLRQLG